MYLKKLFDRLGISLFIIVLLYTGIRMAKSQDSAEIWKDSETGLIWTVEDNGSNFNWNQANAYCENLTLGGHTDWRLPTIDELKLLYDKSLSKQYKVKGPINLKDPGIWSGTTNNSGDAWSFNFGHGGSALSPAGGPCATLAHALCTCEAGSE